MSVLRWNSIDPATGQMATWNSGLKWSGGPTPPTTKKQKSKTMKRQPYYPSRAADQIVWLANFWNKLAGHATALGISVEACAAAIADARWIIYILGTWLPAVRAWQKSCTDAVAAAQSGENAAAPIVMPVFVPPPLPGASGTNPAVVARPEGAVQRLFDIIAAMKEADGYDLPIGTDLGVEGSEQTGPDFDILRPLLKARVVGSKVELDWGWEGYGKFLDQCEIQVDRGAGYQVLTFDTTPGYTDNHPHPATPTRWKYRAIYRVDDDQVGLWSEEISVVVGG